MTTTKIYPPIYMQLADVLKENVNKYDFEIGGTPVTFADNNIVAYLRKSDIDKPVTFSINLKDPGNNRISRDCRGHIFVKSMLPDLQGYLRFKPKGSQYVKLSGCKWEEN